MQPKKWASDEDTPEVSETVVKVVVQRIRWRVLVVDWLNLIFDGFRSVVTGLLGGSLSTEKDVPPETRDPQSKEESGND